MRKKSSEQNGPQRGNTQRAMVAVIQALAIGGLTLGCGDGDEPDGTHEEGGDAGGSDASGGNGGGNVSGTGGSASGRTEAASGGSEAASGGGSASGGTEAASGGAEAASGGGSASGGTEAASGGAEAASGGGSGGDSCQGTVCGDECVNVQTSAEHCGGCDTSCGAEELCSEGACVAPSEEVMPWGEAAMQVWPDPASAPDGLIMTEELDAKLFIEQELAAQTGGETAGFLHIVDGKMTFSFDPRPVGIESESVWHTHPGGTSFSPYDIANWGSDPADWGQWATVRDSLGNTFVLLHTEASPPNLDHGQLVSENESIRSDIFDYMIQEFGHNSDIEASHWSVFEMARRYDWVYYLATPGSLILRRVTTEGPTNELDNPGGYPASILD